MSEKQYNPLQGRVKGLTTIQNRIRNLEDQVHRRTQALKDTQAALARTVQDLAAAKQQYGEKEAELIDLLADKSEPAAGTAPVIEGQARMLLDTFERPGWWEFVNPNHFGVRYSFHVEEGRKVTGYVHDEKGMHPMASIEHLLEEGPMRPIQDTTRRDALEHARWMKGASQ